MICSYNQSHRIRKLVGSKLNSNSKLCINTALVFITPLVPYTSNRLGAKMHKHYLILLKHNLLLLLLLVSCLELLHADLKTNRHNINQNTLRFAETKPLMLLSVLQFLYHAWIKDPKAALKARSKEKRKFWKRYTKGVRHRKSKKDRKQVLETINNKNNKLNVFMT